VEARTYTGYTIKVGNAEKVIFDDKIARKLYAEKIRALYAEREAEEFLTCRNYQFGAQVFGADAEQRGAEIAFTSRYGAVAAAPKISRVS
jgi:hypothetical protein